MPGAEEVAPQRATLGQGKKGTEVVVAVVVDDDDDDEVGAWSLVLLVLVVYIGRMMVAAVSKRKPSFKSNPVPVPDPVPDPIPVPDPSPDASPNRSIRCFRSTSIASFNTQLTPFLCKATK